MKIFVFSIIIILTSFIISFAQVLKVTATVEYEHLQSDEQKILSDFGYEGDVSPMISVGFWPNADVVEILRRLILSIVDGEAILLLIQERGIADVSAAL